MAVHALVEVLRDVVALDAVRNQRRLFLKVARDKVLVLFRTEHIVVLGQLLDRHVPAQRLQFFLRTGSTHSQKEHGSRQA